MLVPLAGCDRPPAFPAAPVQVAEPESDSCLVSGRIVSKAWSDKRGGIERGIVRAWRIPEHELVEEAYGTGEEFQIRLPPGQYRLIFSANGSRGATFEVESRELTVADDVDRIPMDEVDLPISKTTGLYGRQAPELDGIIAWQGTSPLLVKALRGRVIVLDFFAYTCSICHAHKPDLIRLRDQYEGEGLVVLAIHDASLATLEEMNARMEPALRRAFGGAPPPFQMALDGSEQAGVFEAYGIYAVPAVILIDQGGRVVRRYHHAGDPELAADVHELLTRDLSKAF
ncbi:MAG: TlpA family protein disulfide reductase [Planctomyces sp.]|nr:TlpA family protein disulfide reductase [Planctomyces sp.]